MRCVFADAVPNISTQDIFHRNVFAGHVLPNWDGGDVCFDPRKDEKRHDAECQGLPAFYYFLFGFFGGILCASKV